jgi:hypothetical protein
MKTGDYVMTPVGTSVQVKAVKRTIVLAGPHTNPYEVPVGTYGCKKRLLISPDHKIAIPKRGLVCARELGLQQIEMQGEIEYYNLRLEGEAQMVVQGVAVESLAHIDRVVMTRTEFVRRVRERFGDRNVDALVAATCRMIGEDHVEVPMHVRSRKS